VERKDLLGRVSFGTQVAEDERRDLARYFVETDQWRRIVNGEIDVVRGEKGAGKSAIYALLIEKEADFFDKRTIIIAGENPRGDTVFRDIATEPPASEAEFIILWKLYIVALVAREMRGYDIRGKEIGNVYRILEDEKLIEEERNLASILRNVQQTAKRLLRSINFETSMSADTTTGTPLFGAKISLKEPTTAERANGFLSIDNIFSVISKSLKENDWKIWILLDRLDVAFIDNHDLEANALRALMRVYNDIKGFDNVSMKIFLREDIWKKISAGGFREASHIIRYVLLSWDSSSLLNLIMRRVLSNDVILKEFGVDKESVLQSAEQQSELFLRLFPRQVEPGKAKSLTLKWMITRCADGTRNAAPRELIHLLNCLREQESRRLELAGPPPPGDQLFDRSVFKIALPTVSSARLNQYLYAEYPKQRPFIEKLEKQKTEQTPSSLGALWEKKEADAIIKARELVELGFFEERGTREEPTFWVPFLYRDALHMIQGKAGEAGESDEESDD
jgi:hypothetical protein